MEEIEGVPGLVGLANALTTLRTNDEVARFLRDLCTLPELEALAQSLGVGDRIRFTGPLPHEQALAELARCHIHVMPSRIDGFGVAHVEAMAAGLPTIGGAGTGAEDIAGTCEGAFLVRPGDSSALVRTLDELLRDDARRAQLGEEARRTVAERFSWETGGNLTVDIYRSAIESHG